MSLRRVPRTVWMLGFTSLFMDISSEIVHSLLPLLLVGTLGASVLLLGLIDGLAEATASFTKILSGALSDWLGRRKVLALVGYGLAALTKPFFPLAMTPWAVFGARFFDRLGKGIRGAPRDALIADSIGAGDRGAAFGLRQGLDTLGALIGPLAAAGLMLWFAGDIRTVLWFACIPALIAVAVLALGVSDPPASERPPRPEFPLRRRELGKLGPAFWMAMALVALLLLPRCGEAFLLLRGQMLGLASAEVPLILAVMNLVAAPAALAAGLLSDRFGRGRLVAASTAILILAAALLAWAPDPNWCFLAAAIWGLQHGAFYAVFAAYVADRAPKALRGTAFGIYHLVSGFAVLASNLGVGWLWQSQGPMIAFAALAGVAALGLAAMPLLLGSISRTQRE